MPSHWNNCQIYQATAQIQQLQDRHNRSIANKHVSDFAPHTLPKTIEVSELNQDG